MSGKNKDSIIALIKVRRNDCKVTNYVSTCFENVTVKRLKIMEDYTMHCIIFNKIEEFDEKMAQLEKVSFDYIRVSKNKVWSEGKTCSACYFFAKSECNILGSKPIGGNTIVFRIMVPNKIKLKEIIHNLDNSGMEFQIIDSYYTNEVDLTEREKCIINKIFTSGYFDINRKTSLTELAGSMNISTASLSETMRTALRKIIKTYIDDNI